MGVIARQSIKGSIANYIGVAIGFFVSFFVLTRYLTQEEVGLTRVMVDAAILFSSLAQLGSNSSIVRFFPYFRDDRDNHGIFGWSILLPAIGFTLISLLFFVFRHPLLAMYSENAPLLADYFYLLPMLTFFMLYLTVFETNASVLMRIAVPKMVREVGVRLFNLVCYLLYGFHVISLDLFVWLFCGSYALAMLLNLAYLMSLGHISFRIDRNFLDRGKLKEILRYTLFMSATVLAGNIPLFNSLFLGAKAGLALTGVYTIASYVANVVEIPYRSLGAISRPVVAAAAKENNWDEVNRLGRQVSLHQFLVSMMIFFLIWTNIDALFAVIPNGKAYAGGVGVVFLLGMAKVVNSSLSISTDILNYSRHYPFALLFIGLLTLSTIVLNIYLIDLWGINGSASASLFAYGIYFLCLLLFLWGKLRVNLFCSKHFVVAFLMMALFGLHYLWVCFVSPLFVSMGVLGEKGTMIADSGARTVVLLAIALVAIYKLHISKDIDAIYHKFLRRK